MFFQLCKHKRNWVKKQARVEKILNLPTDVLVQSKEGKIRKNAKEDVEGG